MSIKRDCRRGEVRGCLRRMKESDEKLCDILWRKELFAAFPSSFPAKAARHTSSKLRSRSRPQDDLRFSLGRRGLIFTTHGTRAEIYSLARNYTRGRKIRCTIYRIPVRTPDSARAINDGVFAELYILQLPRARSRIDAIYRERRGKTARETRVN